MANDLAQLDATAQAELVRAGDASPIELVDAGDPLRAITRALPFASYTAPFNITGQPAMSLPTSWSDTGLPIGVPLVAAPFREDVLVQLAAQVESAGPWAARRPPVFA
jgi:amidase